MSRRSRRGREAPGGARREGEARGGRDQGGGQPAGGAGGGPGRPPNKISFAAQVLILIAVFAATVGLAELAGAANLGVAFGIAQIVFSIVLVGLLLWA
jgi:hypothetical protein